MKATIIILNIFLISIVISLLYIIYTSYWREKNKLRKPYNFEDEERLMKTIYPDDPEIDYVSWRKYIFSQRQLMN